MKSISILLLSTLLISNFLACSQSESIHRIDPDIFEKKIAGPGIQVVDVRTPAEFKTGHLENAYLINWKDTSQFARTVSKLDKNKEVYVYCQTGVRSEAASKRMAELGFTKIYKLNGGLNNWKKHGKAVDNNAPARVIE